MKKIAKKFLTHPLIAGSIVLVFGSLFANIFNLFFSLLMVRLLAPEDFGTLSSITAVCAFVAITANAFIPLIIILAGGYFAEKRFDMIAGLYIKLAKLFFICSVIICGLFFVFIPQINLFFNINDYNLLIITDGIIFLSLMTALNIGFLQAKLAFRFYVFIMCATTIIKLIFAWIFVTMGLSVVGAAAGIFIGTLIPYFLSFIPFSYIFSKKSAGNPRIDKKLFVTYGIPAGIIGFGLSGLITNDLIFAKHYFSSDTAGLYAGLSLIGRIIFYISAPITSVMFPLIVKQYTRKENYINTFLLAFLLILVSSVIITIFYSIFPKFSILLILKKPEYLSITPYLTLLSVSMIMYSLLYVIANFLLSIKKIIVTIPIIIAVIIQVILMILFHQNIQQIVYISLIVNSLLFIYLTIYFVIQNNIKQNK